MESDLAGKDGQRHYERGGDGQMIPTGAMAEVAAVDGRDVRLTIDRDLQWYFQQAIAAQVAASGAESGNVFAMEVETGNILALAESPTVDPNDPGAVPAEDRGSRALSDVIEPGSTAKVITAAAALEEGIVTPESQFVVPDRYTTEQRPDVQGLSPAPAAEADLRRHPRRVVQHRHGDGRPAADAARQRYEYLQKFGLGQPSGLDFPGQTNGILAPADSWDGRQQFTVLFGQGVSVNALQSAQVFATIANDGKRMTPRLVDAVADENGTMVPTPASEGTQVVSAETAQQVRSMLEGAVTEGTGGNADDPRLPDRRQDGYGAGAQERRLQRVHRLVHRDGTRGGPQDRHRGHPAATGQRLLRRHGRRPRLPRRDVVRAPGPGDPAVGREGLAVPADLRVSPAAVPAGRDRGPRR